MHQHDIMVSVFVLLHQEVQVDFEARIIDETDFHGIRRLLQQVMKSATIVDHCLVIMSKQGLIDSRFLDLKLSCTINDF